MWGCFFIHQLSPFALLKAILLFLFLTLSSQTSYSNGTIRVAAQTELNNLGDIALSENGEFAAIHRAAGLIEVWNIRKNSLVASLPTSDAGFHGANTLVFSPKGNFLYVGYYGQAEDSIYDAKKYLWDIENGTYAVIGIDNEELQNFGEVPIFSDDQRYLLFPKGSRFEKTGALFQISRNEKGAVTVSQSSVHGIQSRHPRLYSKYRAARDLLTNRAWRRKVLRRYKDIYQAEYNKYINPSSGYTDGRQEVEGRFLRQQAAYPDLIFTDRAAGSLFSENRSNVLLKVRQKQISLRNNKLYVGEKMIGAKAGIYGSTFAVIDSTNKYLVSGHADGSLRLWSLKSGKQLAFVKSCDTAVSSVAIGAISKTSGTDGENTWPGGLGLCSGKRPFLVDFHKQSNRTVSDFVIPEEGWKIQSSLDGKTAILFGSVNHSRKALEFARAFTVGSGTPLLRLYMKSRFSEQRNNYKQYFDIPSNPILSPDGKKVVFGRMTFKLRLGKVRKYVVDRKKTRNPKLFYNSKRFVQDYRNSPHVFIRKRGRKVIVSTLYERDSFFLDGTSELVSLSNLNDESQYGTLARYSGRKMKLQIENPKRGSQEGVGQIDKSRVLGSIRGKVILTGDDNGKVYRFDPATYRPMGEQQVHYKNLTGISKNSLPEQVVTTSADGEIGVWRWSDAEGKLIKKANMFALTDGKWLTITPAGFFASSSRNIEALKVVRGLDVYAVSQFSDHLFRPDLVERSMGRDAQRIYKNAATRLNLEKILKSGKAPAIKPVAEKGVVVADGSVSATVRIIDAGGGIGGKVVWRVNGVTREISEASVDDTAKSREVSVKLRLDTRKENIIEVNAYNKAGLLSTEPFLLHVKKQASSEKPLPQMHILAIGVSDYVRNDWDLDFAHRDAELIGKYLGQAAKGIYKGVHVTTLTNEQVTRDQIEKTFQKISARVLPTDVFVLFVAGHGRNVTGSYYFIQHDLTFRNGQTVEDGISQDNWQSWLKLISAEKSILIFDTCESAAATGLTRGSSDQEAAIDRLRHATGRSIITAARQAAYEGYNGHGILTWTILEALTGAKSEEVDLYKLAAHIDREVPKITHKLFGIRQRPHSKIEGNFPVGLQVLRTASLKTGGDVKISKTSTHALLRDETIRSKPESESDASQDLTRGMRVRLLELSRNGNWALIARDGKKLGYVPKEALLPLH